MLSSNRSESLGADSLDFDRFRIPPGPGYAHLCKKILLALNCMFRMETGPAVAIRARKFHPSIRFPRIAVIKKMLISPHLFAIEERAARILSRSYQSREHL